MLQNTILLIIAILRKFYPRSYDVVAFDKNAYTRLVAEHLWSMILFPDGPNFSTALIEAFDPSYFIETFPVLLSLSLVVGLCLISLVVNVGILASGICVPVPCLFCCLNSQVNSLHPNFSIHILYVFPLVPTRRIHLTIKTWFNLWSFPLILLP